MKSGVSTPFVPSTKDWPSADNLIVSALEPAIAFEKDCVVVIVNVSPFAFWPAIV